MRKYLQVFKISFLQEFSYRVNFIMWRVRNVFQIFMVFFLWDAVFANPGRVVFGYDRAKIMTYVFGLLIIRAFVFSAKTAEVAGEVARGDLSNYLVKPVNYFKYWLTRDVSSKVLNLSFAFFETLILFYLLKPAFFLQTDPVLFIAFAISLLLAMFIYFVLLFITSSVPFWVPEAAWGVHFLLTVVVVEFLSGALFPLDILPETIRNIIDLTPFPYLIFFPLQVYLGKIVGFELVKGIMIAIVWAGILYYGLNVIWNKGLRVYQSQGR